MTWMIDNDKDKVDGRPIQRVGQVERSARAHPVDGTGVQSIQEGSPKGGTGRSEQEGKRHVLTKAGPGRAGLSLRSYHAALNAEGYVPPPPVEVPFTHAGYKRHEPKGLKLTDGQVIALRAPAISRKTYQELGDELGVSSSAVRNAMRGVTFRHLNYAHPPLL